MAELTQPELKAMILAASQSLARGPSLATRVRRRLALRLEGDDERERLLALARLRARGLLDVGRFTYGVPQVLTFGSTPPQVSIGAFCSISAGVMILLDGDHRVDWISTYPFRLQLQMPGMISDGHPVSRGPVRIGNDVWICREALILSGVTIGDGAVIGARAVVTRDVAPYSVVAGNPARHMKYRFPEDVIAGLLRVRWWDWPESKIRESIPALCDANVREFLIRHGALP
jgi:carbonic anhydrase/acetyltransferase-like protein (isoleucine patch superfamily)